ncbi:MAG: TrbG/VirB9 family P-type conjugative transfer protein [Sphingomonadales bacterium]|nr:TrbG/VirB9 family P-type conjugative transfer protein [Sphingomonadales bacterium]
MAVGDSAGWQVSANKRGDFMFVKNLEANRPTNLTVVTDVRTYSFELLGAYPGGRPAPMWSAFFIPSPRALRSSRRPTTRLTIIVSQGHAHCGPKRLRWPRIVSASNGQPMSACLRYSGSTRMVRKRSSMAKCRMGALLTAAPKTRLASSTGWSQRQFPVRDRSVRR